MEMNPRWWPPWHNRGVYWARKGDTVKAISDLETARGLAPGNADVLRDLGIYYDRAGRLADAEQCLRQSLDLRPSHRAYAALAFIRERQGRPAESAALLEQAARLSPKESPHLLQSGIQLEPRPRQAARGAKSLLPIH